MSPTRWIHERNNWTAFKWDNSRLTDAIERIHAERDRRLKLVESLGLGSQAEAASEIFIADILSTSKIEGEFLNPDSVRSSVLKQLGMDFEGLPSPTKDTAGITELVVDANSNFTEPLTEQRLCRWHGLLFPTGRSSYGKITVGAWRTDQGGPMQVVSGGIGMERVHFQAPPATQLADLMAEFLEWFEASDRTDPLVRAGVAHFWFVTIHPFDDGNGRIGRAIADLALARAHAAPARFYSLSTQIEADRKSYYRYLEHHQAASTRDLTLWLLWFLETVADAIANSGTTMQASVLRAAVWQDIARLGVSDRQRKALTRFLAPGFQGHLTARKYMKMTSCSHPTAYRDITDLLNKQILEQNPGGSKNSSYRLADRFSA